jgi:hypothetical protein
MYQKAKFFLFRSQLWTEIGKHPSRQKKIVLQAKPTGTYQNVLVMPAHSLTSGYYTNHSVIQNNKVVFKDCTNFNHLQGLRVNHITKTKSTILFKCSYYPHFPILNSVQVLYPNNVVIHKQFTKMGNYLYTGTPVAICSNQK